MSATSPFEIITGPLTVYVAPVGTAFPDVADAPSGTWVLLGVSGDLNYNEDGVTIRHTQNIEKDAFRPVGATGPRKAARGSEDLEVEFTLMDVRASMYAEALNGASQTVTTTAAGSGTGGNKNFNLHRGVYVAQRALLIRGVQSPEASSEGSTFRTQWEIPRAIQSGEPELVFVKDQPVGLQFMYTVLWDATLGFGKMRMQHQAAA